MARSQRILLKKLLETIHIYFRARTDYSKKFSDEHAHEILLRLGTKNGQWKLCVQMSSHYLGNNRKQQWNIDGAFRIYSTTHG